MLHSKKYTMNKSSVINYKKYDYTLCRRTVLDPLPGTEEMETPSSSSIKVYTSQHSGKIINDDKSKMVYTNGRYDLYLVSCITEHDNILHCFLKAFMPEYQNSTQDRQRLVDVLRRHLRNSCNEDDDELYIRMLAKNSDSIRENILELLCRVYKCMVYVFSCSEELRCRRYTCRMPIVYMSMYKEGGVYSLCCVKTEEGLVSSYNFEDNPYNSCARSINAVS